MPAMGRTRICAVAALGGDEVKGDSPSGAAPVRLFDLALALLLLGALAPWWLARALLGLTQTGRLVERRRLLGRDRRPFERLAFAGTVVGRGGAVLLNILRGDMAFAGPRPLTLEEAAAVPVEAERRFAVRPGLFSPYRLQRLTGIAHDPESELDRAFAERASLRGSLGLIVRSLLALLLGGGDRPTPPSLDFFGVPIVNTTMDEALDWIVARAAALPLTGAADPWEKPRNGSLLAFVNPDCLNIAYRNERYRAVLQSAARVLPDGIGLKIGCRMLGVGLAANVNGTDLFPRLCERAAREGLRLFLLGARPGVAEQVAANMRQRYPALVVAGVQHGYFDSSEQDAIIERINDSRAHLVLVAFGVPRQELWLAEHHQRLRPPVRLGVGGLFDFYSGRIPRAPLWLREIGLEWVWRLAQEPGRMWRRYLLGNPLFLYRVWRQARREAKR
ncbi:MAG: WecB/TagA/CpsF family glycosyltransferase [Candidatus Competibacteraceae bacterium]|nr:WecB/TagA/CpsF family glycosyltransferase [Candidatus Competibacteraceae bacterium]